MNNDDTLFCSFEIKKAYIEVDFHNLKLTFISITLCTYCLSRKKFHLRKPHDRVMKYLIGILAKRMFQDSWNSADIRFCVAVDIFENIIFPSCPSGKYKSRKYEIGNVCRHTLHFMYIY